MLPLNDIIGQLAPHAENTGLMFELLGTKGANAGLVLGALGEENLRGLTAELENSEGAAQDMADIMGGGLWGAIKKIQSIVESAYISLGERFGPAVEWVANLFAKLPAPIQEVTVVTGSLVGAMGGLMLLAPGSFGAIVQFPGKLLGLAKSLKLVTAAQWLYNAALTANPIGLVVAAVALLAAGFYLLWKRHKSLQKTFDAAAASTEDLTDRYDDLTEKVAAAEAQLELVRRGAVRDHPIYARKLRALTKERAELDRHIQQRAEATEAAKWFAAAEKKAAKAVKKLADAEAKATEATDKATEATDKAAAAAEAEAQAVHDLANSWTGATVKSGRFLEAVKKLTPAQKKNDRIMDQVLDKYDSLREVLGPFNEELEAQWQATERLNPVLAAQRKETEQLEAAAKKLAEEALAELTKEQEKLAKAAEDLNGRLEGQRRRLLNIPTDDAIRDFGELTQTWKGLNDEVKQGDVLERYGALLVTAAEAGHELNAAQIAIVASMEDVKEVTEDATASASRYDLALAGIAGKMGGAAGQALNLIIAMREHNKTQKAAAAAGKKTEAQFGKMRTGAAKVAFAFSAIGDAIGGTAGKVLSELGKIASAFATGGIVGGIIAGAASLIKGIKGLFGRGKRKREAAAKAAAEAAEKAAAKAAAAALKATEARQVAELAGLQKHREAVLGMIEQEQAEALGLLADRQAAEMDSLQATQAERMDVLKSAQAAEMDSLQATQAAEMDSLQATRAERMDILKSAQAAQLSEIKAAQQRELDALAAARNAQLSVVESAIRRELEDERIMAQLKIDIRKAGDDSEAVTAALARASESQGRLQERDELKALMDEAEARVRARYQDELDAINENWDKKETLVRTHMDKAEANAQERHQTELDTFNENWDEKEILVSARHGIELTELTNFHAVALTALEDMNALELAILGEHQATVRQGEEQFWAEELASWTAHFDQKLRDMKIAHAAALGETLTFVDRINETTFRLKDRTVTIRTVHVTEHRTPTIVPTRGRQVAGGGAEDDDIDALQHGGPVRSGRRYLVGEAGPEMFVPSQGGRIEPHGTSGGGIDAKALGRAVADALEGTEIKVDGRKLGRLTVRHQPLAIAELGGRR